MKDVKPLNVLAFTMLVLSIGVYATTQLMPSYAADPSTFMSCETGGGGCAVRLNTTSHIILNSTGTVHYPTNGTYSSGSGLNMTLGFLSFETHQFRNFQVGAVHSVVYEDTNRNGESRFMLLGGTIAAVQTTTLHFMPRFDDAANFETLSISGDGTNYRIDVMQAGTGSARPLIIEMDGNDIITFGITNTLDFNSRVTSNVGAAGNDLGASNTLVSTTFSGAVNGGNNALNSWDGIQGRSDNGFLDIKTNAATVNTGELRLQTQNNVGALVSRLRLTGNAATSTAIWTSVTHSGFKLGGAMSASGFDVNDLNIIKSSTTGFTTQTFTHDIKFDTSNALNNAALTRLNIEGNIGTATITMSNANFAVPTNNTLSMFSDAVRVANIFSVVNTAKSQVTGLLLESDITPNIGESFAEGDIVCLYKPFSFTKCNQDNDTLVLGPVHFLQARGIIGYENITKYRMVEQTEYYAKNITDADGKIRLIRAERIIREPFRDTETLDLDNGTEIISPKISSR